MKIFNSNTTGHSQKQERKFSKKLFVALVLLATAAGLTFLLIGQQKTTTPAKNSSLDANATSSPLPTQDQQKNNQ